MADTIDVMNPDNLANKLVNNEMGDEGPESFFAKVIGLDNENKERFYRVLIDMNVFGSDGWGLGSARSASIKIHSAPHEGPLQHIGAFGGRRVHMGGGLSAGQLQEVEEAGESFSGSETGLIRENLSKTFPWFAALWQNSPDALKEPLWTKMFEHFVGVYSLGCNDADFHQQANEEAIDESVGRLLDGCGEFTEHCMSQAVDGVWHVSPEGLSAVPQRQEYISHVRDKIIEAMPSLMCLSKETISI
jgi:hypothetical protein